VFLEGEAGVIGADGDSHDWRLYCTLSVFGSQLSAVSAPVCVPTALRAKSCGLTADR